MDARARCRDAFLLAVLTRENAQSGSSFKAAQNGQPGSVPLSTWFRDLTAPSYGTNLASSAAHSPVSHVVTSSGIHRTTLPGSSFVLTNTFFETR